jgi:hypothetical protein
MCMELRESVRFLLGWRPMLASPVLQIARSLDWWFSKRSLGLKKRRAALQEQAFTFISMCSLLAARYAVVHQNLFFGSLFGT